MTISNSQQLVEVRALKPFCGSYKCALEDADTVDDGIEEKDGVVIKTRVPRKRFMGTIPTERRATQEEFDAWKAGAPPEGLEFSDDGRLIITRYGNEIVKVPADMASSLITRGLAERVSDTDQDCAGSAPAGGLASRINPVT